MRQISKINNLDYDNRKKGNNEIIDINLQDIFLGENINSKSNKNRDKKEKNINKNTNKKENVIENDDNKNEMEMEIDKVRNINYRKSVSTAWKEGEKHSREYIRTHSPLGLLQTISYEYINFHLSKILIMYLIISILMLTIKIFRKLTNNNNSNNNNKLSTLTVWQSIQPWTHTHLEIISPSIDILIKSILPPKLSLFITPNRPFLLYLFLGLILFLIPIGSFDVFFRPSVFISNYSSLLYWSVSYGIALFSLLIIQLIFSFIQYISSNLLILIIFILRHTIWCKFIRRKFRFCWKSVKKIFVKITAPMIQQYALSTYTFLLYVFMGLFVSVLRQVWPRGNGPNAVISLQTMVLSVVSLMTTILVILSIVFLILFPAARGTDIDDSDQYLHHRSISALLILVPDRKSVV